ncbi:MAG TPA: anti-sigma regulatory factor [Terriglobia bacterium]|nr:anti-sigma regulatory factor [Terriglobia bacterium]
MTEDIFVPINSDLDIVTARQNGRTMAAELGFQGTDLTLIATAISELARNIVRYARHGEIHLQVLGNNNGKRGLLVEARDEGPGIPNIAQAMQDGYSTSGGLGLGLPGTRRLMDEFEITSDAENGTTIRTCKWVRSGL